LLFTLSFSPKGILFGGSNHQYVLKPL